MFRIDAFHQDAHNFLRKISISTSLAVSRKRKTLLCESTAHHRPETSGAMAGSALRYVSGTNRGTRAERVHTELSRNLPPLCPGGGLDCFPKRHANNLFVSPLGEEEGPDKRTGGRTVPIQRKLVKNQSELAGAGGGIGGGSKVAGGWGRERMQTVFNECLNKKTTKLLNSAPPSIGLDRP